MTTRFSFTHVLADPTILNKTIGRRVGLDIGRAGAFQPTSTPGFMQQVRAFDIYTAMEMAVAIIVAHRDGTRMRTVVSRLECTFCAKQQATESRVFEFTIEVNYDLTTQPSEFK